jgi:hypothetical protein
VNESRVLPPTSRTVLFTDLVFNVTERRRVWPASFCGVGAIGRVWGASPVAGRDARSARRPPVGATHSRLTSTASSSLTRVPSTAAKNVAEGFAFASVVSDRAEVGGRLVDEAAWLPSSNGCSSST